MTVEKIIEKFEDEKLEKIEIEIQPSDINAKLQVPIWEDRFIHLICWERTKSQKWDWEYDGRFLPAFTGKDFLVALEETRSMAFMRMQPSLVDLFAAPVIPYE